MKKVLLFIVLSSILKVSSAQTFAPEGSFWHYCHMGLASQFNYYDSLSYRGDTVAFGKTLKKIGPYLFYVNGDSTFRVENNGDQHILYNFSLEVGDTMLLRNQKTALLDGLFSSLQPTGYITCEVVENGNILLGNDSVRYYQLKGIRGSYDTDTTAIANYGYVNITVVEKIGLYDTRGMLIPEFSCGACDYQQPFLTKFDTLNTPAVYQNSWFLACGYLSVDESEVWEGNIFPNPAVEVLSVINPYSENVYASIIDIHGRKVRDGILLSGNMTSIVSLSDLSSGIYILSISVKGGTVTQKIIKQ